MVEHSLYQGLITTEEIKKLWIVTHTKRSNLIFNNISSLIKMWELHHLGIEIPNKILFNGLIIVLII